MEREHSLGQVAEFLQMIHEKKNSNSNNNNVNSNHYKRHLRYKVRMISP